MAKIQKGGDLAASGGKALIGIMTIVGRIAFILFVVILFAKYHLRYQPFFENLFTGFSIPYFEYIGAISRL